jgi:hypothetical protein
LDGLGSPANSIPFTDAHRQESVISLYPLADTGESIFNEFCRDFIVVAHIVGSLQCSGMTASLHGGKLH